MNQSQQQSERWGAIGVIVRDDGCLLVIERSATVRAPGRLCFPGGGIESGETEELAVERELQEELSLVVKPVRRLWQSETQSGVCLAWWLASYAVHQIPVANPTEVADWFWMSPEEMACHPKTLLSNREFLSAVKSGTITLAR